MCTHSPTPSYISKMVNAFPFSISQAVQMDPSTLYVQLSMWINGDWRVAESGWCRVINQHNECDEHCADGAHTQDCVTQQEVSLRHSSASCIAPTVFLRRVSLASLSYF